MTPDHSALLAQLDALKSADAGAVFAELIRAGLQALIEAEATEKIGAAATNGPRTAALTAMGIAPRRFRPPPAISRSRSPSYGWGRSSRRCSSGAAGSTGRCTR